MAITLSEKRKKEIDDGFAQIRASMQSASEPETLVDGRLALEGAGVGFGAATEYFTRRAGSKPNAPKDPQSGGKNPGKGKGKRISVASYKTAAEKVSTLTAASKGYDVDLQIVKKALNEMDENGNPVGKKSHVFTERFESKEAAKAKIAELEKVSKLPGKKGAQIFKYEIGTRKDGTFKITQTIDPELAKDSDKLKSASEYLKEKKGKIDADLEKAQAKVDAYDAQQKVAKETPPSSKAEGAKKPATPKGAKKPATPKKAPATKGGAKAPASSVGGVSKVFKWAGRGATALAVLSFAHHCYQWATYEKTFSVTDEHGNVKEIDGRTAAQSTLSSSDSKLYGGKENAICMLMAFYGMENGLANVSKDEWVTYLENRGQNTKFTSTSEAALRKALINAYHDMPIEERNNFISRLRAEARAQGHDTMLEAVGLIESALALESKKTKKVEKTTAQDTKKADDAKKAAEDKGASSKSDSKKAAEDKGSNRKPKLDSKDSRRRGSGKGISAITEPSNSKTNFSNTLRGAGQLLPNDELTISSNGRGRA